MDFYSPASLGFYSSVKIAATLFCHQDLVSAERRQLLLIGWVQVEDSVAQLVRCLRLPRNGEQNVQELIQPVGDQIRSWLISRAFVVRLGVDLYDKFSWTSHGMIDYRRTAVNLIESQQLDLSTKFTLACLDAVEEYIDFVLRDQCAVEVVQKSMRRINCHLRFDSADECTLVLRYRTEEGLVRCRLTSDNPETAAEKTAWNGYTSLTRYLMAKIDPPQKASLTRKLVLNFLRNNYRSLNLDTLLFLLSQLDIREIDKLFIENTEIVLLRFLEWPLQRHFMKLTNKLWDAISPATFNSILQAIAQHIIQHCSISSNPFGYRDIFRDFWLGSPPGYRRACLNDLIIPILSRLFRSHGYLNAVQILFKDESFHKKLEKLFFYQADAVLEILSNENKAKAFESIVHRYFSPNDIPTDFGKKYSVFTQKYLDSYYGEIDIAD